MGTAEDQGIDVLGQHGAQIFLRGEAGNGVIKPPFFHQRDKKGAGLGKNAGFRRQPADGPGVGIAVDGRGRADDPHGMGPCFCDGAAGTGINDIEDRNGRKGFDGGTGNGGHRIAGNDEEFDLLPKEKFRDLPGIAIDGLSTDLTP